MSLDQATSNDGKLFLLNQMFGNFHFLRYKMAIDRLKSVLESKIKPSIGLMNF